MKKFIIILNILSVLVVIAQLAWMYISAVGSAYGSSSGIGDTDKAHAGLVLFIVVLITTILAIVFSHLDHSKRAIIWAAIPVAYFIVFVIVQNT